jgi:hypothetical protein
MEEAMEAIEAMETRVNGKMKEMEKIEEGMKEAVGRCEDQVSRCLDSQSSL